VVAVLVGLGIGHGVWRSVQTSVSNNSNIGNSNGGSSQSPFNDTPPANTGAIAAEASRGLVDINTDLTYEGAEAAGTGIVLTSNGVILTNNHVISGATSISVTDIGNGRIYRGTVVGYDRTHDIAVVQLKGASGLQTAKIGDSSKISVGDEVVGLGNAGGAGGTPSSAGGQITALNQSITAQDASTGASEQLSGLIETDANIQPGDSGGALVNTSGQVIGVDTAASSGFYFQSQSGQGFAIPINRAMSIANQIRSGQATSDVTIGATAFLGVLVNSTTPNGQPGAYIAKVLPAGPAEAAGLTAGDTITTFSGTTIAAAANLTNLISRLSPGARVEIGWTDTSGQSHHTTIRLGSGPPQ
jgi:S1-C subfamily serine protease